MDKCVATHLSGDSQASLIIIADFCANSQPLPSSRCPQALVVTMIGSLGQLSNVAVLCAFVFLVFGIIAVQLFAGVLDNR